MLRALHYQSFLYDLVALFRKGVRQVQMVNRTGSAGEFQITNVPYAPKKISSRVKFQSRQKANENLNLDADFVSMLYCDYNFSVSFIQFWLLHAVFVVADHHQRPLDEATKLMEELCERNRLLLEGIDCSVDLWI